MVEINELSNTTSLWNFIMKAKSTPRCKLSKDKSICKFVWLKLQFICTYLHEWFQVIEKSKKTSMDVNEEKTLDLSHHQLQKWDIKKAVQILRGKILHFQMFLFLVLKYIYCTLFILLCRGKTNEEDFLFSSYPSISKRQPVDLPSKWFFRGISESSMARPTQQQAWEFVWDRFLITFKGTSDQKGD